MTISAPATTQLERSSALPLSWRRRSRSSTSTRSGRTPATWSAARHPSRSASRASPCAAARCRNGSSPAPGFAGTLAFTLPEALWLAESRRRGPPRRLPDGRPPRAARARGAHRRATGDAGDGDGRLHRAARPDRRVRDRATGARTGTPLRVCIDVDAGWWAAGRTRARRRQALAGAHARAGRRACARDRRPRAACAWWGSWPTRRRSPVSATAAAGASSAAARPRDPRAAATLRARAGRAPRRRGRRRGGGAARRPRHPRSSSSTAAAPAASSRRRGGGGHRARGRLGAVRADAVRRLPRLQPRPAALFALPVVRTSRAGRGRRRWAAAISPRPADRRACRPLPAGRA